MKKIPLLVLVAMLLLAGCRGAEGAKSKKYTHAKYQFTLRYPSEWALNKGNVVPPPPDSTTLGTDQFTIAIIPWSEEPQEPEILRRKQWLESSIIAGDVTVVTFVRPPTTEGEGIVKQAFLQHRGQWFQVALEVHGHPNPRVLMRAFDELITTSSWIK